MDPNEVWRWVVAQQQEAQALQQAEQWLGPAQNNFNFPHAQGQIPYGFPQELNYPLPGARTPTVAKLCSG